MNSKMLPTVDPDTDSVHSTAPSLTAAIPTQSTFLAVVTSVPDASPPLPPDLAIRDVGMHVDAAYSPHGVNENTLSPDRPYVLKNVLEADGTK